MIYWQESYDKPRQHVKKAVTSLCKGLYSQSYGFSTSHVQMWKLDHKEGWVLRNWYFWIVLLERTLESPLDCREIKPVNPKGNQPWIFIRRTDDAEGPILWLPVVEESHLWERPWYWERLKAKGEGKMYYLHRMRWLSSITKSANKYELEQTPETMEFCVLQSIGLQSQTWLSDRKTPSRFCSPTVFQNSFFVTYSLEDITKVL